jgi:hypothetical protein
MSSLNSLALAELRRHELHTDATRVRLAAEARRGRRRQPRRSWLQRIASRRLHDARIPSPGRRPQDACTPSPSRAPATSIARPRSGRHGTKPGRVDKPDAA